MFNSIVTSFIFTVALVAAKPSVPQLSSFSSIGNYLAPTTGLLTANGVGSPLLAATLNADPFSALSAPTVTLAASQFPTLASSLPAIAPALSPIAPLSLSAPTIPAAQYTVAQPTLAAAPFILSSPQVLPSASLSYASSSLSSLSSVGHPNVGRFTLANSLGYSPSLHGLATALPANLAYSSYL